MMVIGFIVDGKMKEMHFIEKQFNEFIVNYINTYNKKDTIKLGILCSGGVDSSVLLMIANKFKSSFNLDIHILHISFNDFTKYKEADELVIKYANLFNNKIITKACDLYSLKSKVKETAREYMKDIAFEDNYDLVLTGHHLDDQIETFLFRVLRGSGLNGLKCMESISKFRKNGMIRLFGKPFLKIRKKDIIRYAHDNDIKYIEDDTNFCNSKSDRNYIRNIIIPVIEHRFNINNINTLINNIKEQLNNSSNDNNFIDIYSGKWHINDFMKLSISNRIFVIREYMRVTFGYNLSKKIIDNLKKKLREDITNLGVDLSMGYCLYRDDNYITIDYIKNTPSLNLF